MPRRTDIHTILIIGAGPIVIGQACEFDYSGAQACKALRAEGYRIVLVNSNPATIMTDPSLADATYIEPITPEFVEKIIVREKSNVRPGRVFALLPTMGGQTALNTALDLHESGVLAAHGVEMIGANAAAIAKAEDRELFREAMQRIGLESPRSIFVLDHRSAMEALEKIGLPAIIRPSFTLGGTGGGIAYNREEFTELATGALDASRGHGVLIEELVLGWKEFELEVVRDRRDNAIIICSIENIDPMGVHTGDSITVAPALTLTDKEYQRMRSASIAVLREIGVETGGSNVQFAISPSNGRMLVIEMKSPRVAFIGTRVQGDRFPDRKSRGQTCGGLHAGRAQQRHHRGYARIVRTLDRLHRHQNSAFCLREISGRRTGADHLDEICWRGHGDRPHFRGVAAKGAAVAGDRSHGAR